MSVRDFIRDPHAYTKGHVVQFSHNGAKVSAAASGMQVHQIYNNWGGAWTAEHYTRIAGQFTDFNFEGDTDSITGAHIRRGKGSTVMHNVECRTSAADLGVRFLPWKPNTVTFMEFDAAATTFFTGPLSGCSIFIGRTAAGTHWAFHANRNATGAPNPAVKTNMLINTVQSLPAPVPIIRSCIYQQHYHDLGFVFGQVKSGQWHFYVADTRAIGAGHFATRVTKMV